MVLPNFLVVGAARSGTSSVARNLATHPEILVADGEVHFFSDDANWERGIEWYEEHFAKAAGAVAVGEKSPSYLYDEQAPGRIAEALQADGQCVFIAILREPVARAVSHVELRRRLGTEFRTVDQAMRDSVDAPSAEAFDYVGRGLYASQLRRYAELFGADTLHIEFHDDLVTDPEAVFARLCDRLGVRPFEPGHVLTRVNESARLRQPRLYRALLQVRAGEWLPRRTGRWLWKRMQEPVGYDRLSPELETRLRAVYEPANVALADFLGSPLPTAWSR